MDPPRRCIYIFLIQVPLFLNVALIFEGLRWIEPKAYLPSLATASPVQRALDSVHAALDLMRLSCRLLQLIITAKQRHLKSKSTPLPDNDPDTVAFLITLIPASTRSDIANRFLDL
jgi:hypothetical protein